MILAFSIALLVVAFLTVATVLCYHHIRTMYDHSYYENRNHSHSEACVDTESEANL